MKGLLNYTFVDFVSEVDEALKVKAYRGKARAKKKGLPNPIYKVAKAIRGALKKPLGVYEKEPWVKPLKESSRTEGLIFRGVFLQN